MQTYQITTGPPPAPKNYVFVDEHNRHKRLKVMRACEGCRRRKIKCDAATTNTWPCGACKRLKLPCVPPVGGLEFDEINDGGLSQPQVKDVNPATTVPFDQYQHYHPPQASGLSTYNHDGIQSSQHSFLQDAYHYMPEQQFQDAHSLSDTYSQRFTPIDTSDVTGMTQQALSSPKTPDNQTAEILSEQLGELRIGENGVAPYARQQTSNTEPDGPIQEHEIDFSPLSTAAGSQIRIPPQLMPDEGKANDTFHTFFREIHPYVPVLCRSQFYHQWQHDRHSLSPLLLETIFACAGRISGEPAIESPWLALANKHEASFLDTPRLSTVQALLLLMKAREGSPKRGYFYKSWMTCKTALSMAKDLDMHEHYAIHQAEGSCDSSPADCIAKTRIWQTISACELMIGAPQGRFDFGVESDSIDFSPHIINSDIDEYESAISLQFSHFAKNVLNIRHCAEAYVKVKRKKDWALDPIFERLTKEFHKWPKELPPKLQLSLPPDGALPQLPSHFIGNMHSHHQLGIIMLHRPQIVALAKQALFDDGEWRQTMSMCYEAAKKLCRIQEAMMRQYDMLGLLCMQRGMSYTIYATLTCIMLHLIALTSPDPEFNSDAREYFVRHMRLLERCMPEWPMPETDKQINNLRAAFSANLDRPFDLRPNFPYGSPSSTTSSIRRSSEPKSDYMSSTDPSYYQPQGRYSQPPPFFPTPPMSNVNSDSKPHTPQYYPNYNITDQPLPQPQFRQVNPTSFPQQNFNAYHAWNPSPIIDQFNTAFAIPPAALQPPGVFNSTSPPISMPAALPQQSFESSPQSPTYDLHAFARHQAQAQAEAQAQAQARAQEQAMQAHSRNQGQQFVPQSSSELHRPLEHSNYLTLQSSGSSQQMPFTSSPYIHATGGQNVPDPAPNFSQSTKQSQPQMPGMVYVSAKEWQQSVASVLDPAGLKRRWTLDTQAGE